MIDFESAPSSGSSSDDRFRGAGSPDAYPVARPRREGIPSYIQALNDRQREAALITEGPLMVLAGAGSGKTKMLTSRISYLIDFLGVPAYQVLAVTFTNKAAGEMRERVDKTLREASDIFYGTPEIGTFHSVCVRLLRREMSITPFSAPFVIYDDSDQLSLIKGVFSKLNIDDKSINPKSVQGAINRAKCDAIEPQDLEPSAHNIFERQVKRVYEQYQKDLFANNALDFGEIITMTYRILRDNQQIRAKYQRRFRYIHVDEYQDTNRSQYLLLSMLAGKGQGGHSNICVVGDEDQSIYKWRGADINNILDFERDYPGGQVVKLEQNYRSTKTIIRAAGEVIKNNRQRKDKTLWTDNQEGRAVVRLQLPDERAEAELSVSELKRLARDEGRAFGDFAIFYRTNAQSRQFEDVLRREKIAYQIVGGLRFYDRKEIKDVLSYFKAILNPSDSVSFKRIINVPARGIGKTTIEKIDEFFAKTTITTQGGEILPISYWEALKSVASDASITSAGTAKKIAHFVKLMQRLMDERPNLLVSELYHLVLDEIGYVRELREEGTEESLARIENLEEFDTLLQEFEETNFHNAVEPAPNAPGEVPGEDAPKKPTKADLLPLFIEQSSLASDLDKLDPFASTVKMMTLHSSKGLEFPVVFMAGMEEGLFPSIKQWEETPEEDIEEERRLCYVGMTRAREALYMMNVIVRRIWGNSNYADPSRFFAEIPAHLIELRDFSARLSANSGFGAPRSTFVNSPAPSFSRPESLRPTRGDDLVGSRLNHPEYGPGTILLVEGSGDDRKVTVEFQKRERRKFIFRYVAAYL